MQDLFSTMYFPELIRSIPIVADLSDCPAFTCSNIIETLEEGVKYVQSEQLRHQSGANDVVLVSLFLTMNMCFICVFISHHGLVFRLLTLNI